MQAKTGRQPTKRYLTPRSPDSTLTIPKLSKPYRPHLKPTRKLLSRNLTGLAFSKKLGPKSKPTHRFKSRTRKLSRYLKFRLGRTRWFSVRQFKKAK